MSSKINIRLSVLIVLILIAAFSRIIPHMLNFSPMGAIGLFGAAHFSKKWQAFLLPVVAIWLSDLFIDNVIYRGAYPGFTWFYAGFYWQYATYLIITLWGMAVVKKVKFETVLLGALGSSLIFFLVTNFGNWPGNPFYSPHLHTWPGSPVYTKDFQGLMACYLAGIPFIKGTVLGDLFYSSALFGVFAFLESKYSLLSHRRQAAQKTVFSN